MTVYGVVDIYEEPQYIWVYPILAFAWVFAFAFAYDGVLNNRGFSGKRFILLVFCLVVASSGVTHAVWFFGTPKWSFTLSTDKSTYAENETVQITVTLKNLGYVPLSFPSTVDPPLIVTISDFRGGTDWYSSVAYHNRTTFTISPGQSLTRTFAWNQTPITVQPPLIVGPGTYFVFAEVPDPSHGNAEPYGSFYASATFNITSTS